MGALCQAARCNTDQPLRPATRRVLTRPAGFSHRRQDLCPVAPVRGVRRLVAPRPVFVVVDAAVRRTVPLGHVPPPLSCSAS
nr:hypothetical protein KPHV_00300 [Kitasatospora purpeofusca]BEK71223.1 hypothetical protein KPHV_84500 [Kitasatospora purpeofusca]